MSDPNNPDNGTGAPGDDDDATKIIQTAPPETPAAPAPPPVTAAPAQRTQSPTDEGEALIGAVINNNYKILELINAGGMGEVYRGEQVFTGDPVAIKIVLPALARDEKVMALFKREARILSQLADEAIVRYYNFVHDPQLDRFCLIMDFIDGVPLKGPIPLDESQRLLVRLANGLDKAHAREVTHRDLSPDNVMLPSGDVEQAVLIDFGIAKSTEHTEGTLHGQFAGKFKYISPEQLGHFDGVISPRTDIYGLALLMAAAMRGKPIDMGSSIVEAVNARRAIPDLDGVYPELQPLIAHMLEPDPALRPARMLDVASMVNNPELIPARYNTGLPPAGDATLIEGGVTAPPFQQPQRTVAPLSPGVNTTGIQAPPTQTPQTLTGVSQSPFGQNTAAPYTMPPAQPAPEPEKSGGAGKWIGILVVLAALGGGGYFAMSQGMIPGMGPQPEVAEEEPELPDPNATGEAAVMPPPDTSTRQGFLAGFGAEEACTYATRITSGLNSGKLEVVSANAGVLTGLPEAYGNAFGAEPAVVERQSTQSQCAALDLTRALQGRDAIEPLLTLDTDEIASGSSVAGRVSDIRGRTVWLALISASGGVYDVSARLEPQPDGSALFQFGMSLGSELDAEPQILVALASNDPVLSLAAIRDGDVAEEVLPLIKAEIASRQGGAAASLGWFLLKPEGT